MGRTLTSTDSDIHSQQVALDQTLHGGLLLIDNSSGTHDTHPGISKSDGNSPSSTQDWTIVFQRTFNANDEDIRYAQVHWDGTITTPSSSLDTAAGCGSGIEQVGHAATLTVARLVA